MSVRQLSEVSKLIRYGMKRAKVIRRSMLIWNYLWFRSTVWLSREIVCVLMLGILFLTFLHLFHRNYYKIDKLNWKLNKLWTKKWKVSIIAIYRLFESCHRCKNSLSNESKNLSTWLNYEIKEIYENISIKPSIRSLTKKNIRRRATSYLECLSTPIDFLKQYPVSSKIYDR